MLIVQGYRAFCADSGKEALNILEHEPIDLMITDIIMSEMDGYQLSASVYKKYPQIKILLMSGYQSEQSQDLDDASWLQNILKKPFTAGDLLINIRNLLDSSGGSRDESST